MCPATADVLALGMMELVAVDAAALAVILGFSLLGMFGLLEPSRALLTGLAAGCCIVAGSIAASLVGTGLP